MSTHSLIIVKTPEDTFKSVYVHNAGDIEAQGRMINQNYNDYSMALDVVGRGNISTLKSDLMLTNFYKNEPTFESKSLGDASLNHPYGPQEMTYFHDGNSWFVCADYPSDDLAVAAGEMIPLEKAIARLDSKINMHNGETIEGEFIREGQSPALSGVKRLGQGNIDSWRASNTTAAHATNTLKGPTP